VREIRRFYIDFLHRPREEYQKFTAYTSPRVGVRVAFFVSVTVFVCPGKNSNAVGINETTLYCLCQQGEFGVMLGCDGDDCSIEWFHLQCIGLSRTPTTEKWLCPHCKDKEPSGTHIATCS